MNRKFKPNLLIYILTCVIILSITPVFNIVQKSNQNQNFLYNSEHIVLNRIFEPRGTIDIDGNNSLSQNIPIPYDFPDRVNCVGASFMSSPNWDGRSVISYQDRMAQDGIRTGPMSSVPLNSGVCYLRMTHEKLSREHYIQSIKSIVMTVPFALADKRALLVAAVASLTSLRTAIQENRLAHNFPASESGKPHKYGKVNEHPDQKKYDAAMDERTIAMLNYPGYIKEKETEADYLYRECLKEEERIQSMLPDLSSSSCAPSFGCNLGNP